ncbi:MAG: class I SAM-dependent methyltransferase [Alphaproteobacteria bacterium]
MSFYEEKILPSVINVACGQKPVMQQRQKVVPSAQGRVLEVGIGSGLNLEFYDRSKIDHLWGLEPSEGIRKKAQAKAEELGMAVEFLGLKGEEIPLDDNSVDTVVITYTMCTIPDVMTALGQMRRVLKPGGQMLFSEHGKAPDAAVRKWQDRLNPIWGVIGGGCNLNRDIPGLVEQAGFKMTEMQASYIPGPKFASFHYWGQAVEA